MSQPIKHWKGPMGFFAPSGYYVSASDYDALVAENERLRKAGDAMHRAIKVSDYALDWAIEVWLAAKEGRDVK